MRSDVVRLEPLDHSHVADLVRAASETRESFAFATVPQDEPSAHRYVQAALADWERGDGLAFATIDAKSDRVLGSTRFARAERWPWSTEPAEGRTRCGIDAVEIGWTWLAPSAQRSSINTHAKILMLDYAFNVIDVRRVTLKTDARNARSRRAIERIGGVLDGVLRAHLQGADGQVRDSAMYSILRGEWPAHRQRLATP